MSVGNSWSYRYSIFDTTGDVVSVSEDSFSVVSDTNIDGRTDYIFSSGVLRWNDENGFWITIENDPLLLFKYPAEIGDEYSNWFKVIAKDSLMNVPAGNFNCYSYTGQITVDFLSPGVGLIKQEWFKSKPDGEKYLHQLQEVIGYQLKWND